MNLKFRFILSASFFFFCQLITTYVDLIIAFTPLPWVSMVVVLSKVSVSSSILDVMLLPAAVIVNCVSSLVNAQTPT